MAQPSFIVGWMSGGIFWPPWKGTRNLFTDSRMRRRAFAFARKAAVVCANFPETVLAIDQGNEICCLPDCLSAPPSSIESWCAAFNLSIRAEFPSALIISGNDQNQFVADTGWRFHAQPGCDLLSIHGYPNSGWHSLPFDGMSDPLGQSLLPLYVKVARTFGPVMLQEFGTIFTKGRCCDDYLETLLPACWEAGANGFLWWGLRDFTATGHPYNKNAFECPLGLVGTDNEVKPVLRALKRFVDSLPQRTTPSINKMEVGLYWPRHFYLRDDPLNPGNEPRTLSRRFAIAHFSLAQLGWRVGVVRGDLPLTSIHAHTLVIPGCALTADEVCALTAWVQAGGRLIWHGLDLTTWGNDTAALIGAVAADMRAPRARGVDAFGLTWDFDDFPRQIFTTALPIHANVTAQDNQGRPVILQNRIGHGSVATCLAQIDDQFARESDDVAVRHRWLTWYSGMLGLVTALRPS